MTGINILFKYIATGNVYHVKFVNLLDSHGALVFRSTQARIRTFKKDQEATRKEGRSEAGEAVPKLSSAL